MARNRDLSSGGIVKTTLNCMILGALLVLSGCRDTVHSDFKGNVLLLKDGRNQWVLVNYWAEWCDPCREEIPDLNALHEAENGVRVWGVDFDGSASQDELASKVSRMAIGFPVLSKESIAALELKQPPVLPATYILDTEGNLRKRLVGPQTREGLEAVIAEL